MLPQIAALAALTIIVVSLMIFYNDMGKPLLAMADNAKAWQDSQKQIVDEMKDIKLNIQSINDELKIEQPDQAAKKPQVPPS